MDKKEDKKDIKTPKVLSATKKPLNGIDIHPQLKVTKESEAEDLTAPLQERKALTIAQRLKRGRDMRAREPRLQRAKEIAARKMAPEEKLKRRAVAAARTLVKKRFSPRRNVPYAELTTGEKIQVDTAVAKKVKLVKKLAARLLPSIRKAEASRLQSFHTGEKLKDLSTPSPKTQAIAPKMDVMKEEVFANLNQCSEEELVSVIESMIIDFRVNDNPFGGTLQDLLFNVLPKDHVTESLIAKSNRSGISYTVLREVFERGLNSYTNSRMTSEQFAFTRVNSYIARGKAYSLDEDLRNAKPLSKLDATFSESYEFVQNKPYVKVNPETGRTETIHPKKGARRIKTRDFEKVKEEAEHVDEMKTVTNRSKPTMMKIDVGGRQHSYKRYSFGFHPTFGPLKDENYKSKTEMKDAMENHPAYNLGVKEEAEHDKCGTPDCCGQCDTAFESYTQNKRSVVNRAPQYKSVTSTKAKTRIDKYDYVVHPETGKPARVINSDPTAKTATIKTHAGNDTSTHSWSDLKHYHNEV